MTTLRDMLDASMSSDDKTAYATDAYVRGVEVATISAALGETRERTYQRLRLSGVLVLGHPAGPALDALDALLRSLDLPATASEHAGYRLARARGGAPLSPRLVRERMQALGLGVYGHDPTQERWCASCKQWHPIAAFSPRARMCRAAWNAYQRDYTGRRRRRQGVRTRAERIADGYAYRAQVSAYAHAHGVAAAAQAFALREKTVRHYCWVVRTRDAILPDPAGCEEGAS